MGLAWNAKVVEGHPVEVWILHVIKEPPLQWILDLLNWMSQVLV